MADSKQLIIDLILENDKMKKKLSETEKASKKTVNEINKGSKSIGNSFKNAFSGIKKGFDSVKKHSLAITATIVGAFLTIKKGFDLSKEFASFEQSASSMASQFGRNAQEVINQLSKAADGTISNAQLIETANKTMALGVTKDVGKMANLLEVARVRARSMGIDTTQAFNDISVGIARQSPLILDNLGIVTVGWQEEAKAAGVAYDAQFFLNKVLDDGNKILKQTGPLVLTSKERFDKLGASFANIRVSLGQKLLPIFEAAAVGLEKLLGVADKGVDLGAIDSLNVVYEQLDRNNARSFELFNLEKKQKKELEQLFKRLRNNDSETAKQTLKNARDKYASTQREIKQNKQIIKGLELKRKELIFNDSEAGRAEKREKERLENIRKGKELTEDQIELLEGIRQGLLDVNKEEIKTLENIKNNKKLTEEQIELIEQRILVLKKEGEVIDEVSEVTEKVAFDFRQLGNEALTAGQNVGEAFKKAKEVSADAKSTGAQNANAIVAIIFAIIAIVEQVGKSMEVAGEKMRKWGDDADTSFGNFVSGLGKASSAVGGHFQAMADGAKKGVPPLLNTFLSIKNQIEANDEAVINSAKVLEDSLLDINREIERQAFSSRLAVVNEMEEAALAAARVSSGLKGIEDAEKAKRKEDLLKAIAEETDAEKKAALQLQLDKIKALEKYAAEEKRIQAEAEEQRKQIKREEYEYEKALRQIDLDSSYSTALMDSESIFGKNNRAEAQARITKAYQANTAALNSLEPPAFEEGGVIKGLNDSRSMEDGFIQAQNGESVLNKNATAVLGEDAINALNSGRGLVPSSVVINVADGTGAVEMLDQYFKTNGTSTRGLLI